MENGFIISNPENWVIITDLHLSSFTKKEEVYSLVSLLNNDYKNYNVLFIGDFLNYNFNKINAMIIYPELFCLPKNKVIWLNGNNDPYISKYNYALVKDDKGNLWTIKHGHKLPLFICNIFNHFKKYKNRSNQLLTSKKIKKFSKKFKNKFIIIGHYHFELFGKNFRVLKPWKIYKLKDILNYE